MFYAMATIAIAQIATMRVQIVSFKVALICVLKSEFYMIKN